MKIAVADNNNGKFTKDIMEHWGKKHEVRFERGSSEYLAQWADVYYVDTWDNNLHYLYKLYHGDTGVSRQPDWNNGIKPRIVVRALDWEVWIGMARDQALIDWVDDVIVIAPHIEKELRKHADFKDKIHLIRPGVNLDKFTMKTKQTDGFQLGMVLGDMWPGVKNHMGGLDIFTTLYEKDPRWRLHIRGQHEPGEYWPVMYEYYLESRGIKDVVTLYPQVEDMNEWYENIDILLHPGQKEAFCYAVGEALAKGIPAVVNDFYGSQDIWGDQSFLKRYRTHEWAVHDVELLHEIRHKIKNPKIVLPPRRFMQYKYDIKRMMEEYDDLLGT